jgi:hypothetical protein
MPCSASRSQSSWACLAVTRTACHILPAMDRTRSSSNCRRHYCPSSTADQRLSCRRNSGSFSQLQNLSASNIYMNQFLKHWRLTGSGDTFYAHVVSYAGDFVILSRGHAAEALGRRRAHRFEANGNWYLNASPVQEECATAQDKDWRPSGAEQYHVDP